MMMTILSRELFNKGRKTRLYALNVELMRSLKKFHFISGVCCARQDCCTGLGTQ